VVDITEAAVAFDELLAEDIAAMPVFSEPPEFEP